MYRQAQQMRIEKIAQSTTDIMTVGMAVLFSLSESQNLLNKQNSFRQQSLLQLLLN